MGEALKRRLILITTSLTVFITGALSAQELVEKPTSYKDGEFWQFSLSRKAGAGRSYSDATPDGIYTYVLRNIKGDIRPREILNNGEERRGGLPLRVLLGKYQDEELQNTPDNRPSDSWLTTQDIKFPLFVGKKWGYSYRPNRDYQRNITVQVVSREQVTTAAGTFEAFRIEKNVNWAAAGGPRGSAAFNSPTLYFYSRETNSIIKLIAESVDGDKREVELIKFGAE